MTFVAVPVVQVLYPSLMPLGLFYTILGIFLGNHFVLVENDRDQGPVAETPVLQPLQEVTGVETRLFRPVTQKLRRTMRL